jgi:hypothetical protein
MRTSILLWSAGSGLIVGVLADLLLTGAVLLIASLLPDSAPRGAQRIAQTAFWVLLALIPLAAAVLGYLEGQLKAS